MAGDGGHGMAATGELGGDARALREWAENNLKEVLNARRRYDAARRDVAA
jgi:hypothetical protein